MSTAAEKGDSSKKVRFLSMKGTLPISIALHLVIEIFY